MTTHSLATRGLRVMCGGKGEQSSSDAKALAEFRGKKEL